jgi:SAM-dependent methyltransferase
MFTVTRVTFDGDTLFATWFSYTVLRYPDTVLDFARSPVVRLDDAVLYETFDTDPRSTIDFLAWVAELAGIPSPLTVLDVGCGPGRLLRPLCALGWRVVGLEPDPVYRKRAEQLAAPLDVDVYPGGFNDIDANAEFDLIIGINSSFAHVVTATQRADALARCRRALRPGGVLVLDLPNLLRILHEYRAPREQQTEVDGRTIRLKRNHTIDYHAATFTTHDTYTVSEADGSSWTAQRDHVYAITAWPDLEYLIRASGFQRVETFASVTDRVPGGVGVRMVITAIT